MEVAEQTYKALNSLHPFSEYAETVSFVLFIFHYRTTSNGSGCQESQQICKNGLQTVPSGREFLFKAETYFFTILYSKGIQL